MMLIPTRTRTHSERNTQTLTYSESLTFNPNVQQFGAGNSGTSQKALEDVLDTCLLNDNEMLEYERTFSKGDQKLKELYFPKA